MSGLASLTSAADVRSRFEEHDYLTDEGTSTAVFLALKLGIPLLLEGEPGVGKTAAAKVLAQVLDAPLIRLQCYEGLTAGEALYDWNYQRQLLAIRLAESHGEKLTEADIQQWLEKRRPGQGKFVTQRQEPDAVGPEPEDGGPLLVLAHGRHGVARPRPHEHGDHDPRHDDEDDETHHPSPGGRQHVHDLAAAGQRDPASGLGGDELLVADERSDVDLLFVMRRPLSLMDLGRLEDEVSAVVGVPVDPNEEVDVLDVAGGHLLRVGADEACVRRDRQDGAAHALARHRRP